MPEVSHLQRQPAIGLVWLYLPTAVERKGILGIHFKLRGRDTAQFDLDALAASSAGGSTPIRALAAPKE